MNFQCWMNEYNRYRSIGQEGGVQLLFMAECAVTFSDWRNVFYRAPAASGLEHTAILKMADLAQTFGQWLNVYQEGAFDDSGFLNIAILKLMEFADNPKDAEAKKRKTLRLPRWQRIFEVSHPGGEVEKKAIQKIVELMLEEKAENAKAPVEIRLKI